jgi:hypothetical protein
MKRTLEERVETLEQKMQAVKESSGKAWLGTFGAFRDDSLFDAAMEAAEL